MVEMLEGGEREHPGA